MYMSNYDSQHRGSRMAKRKQEATLIYHFAKGLSYEEVTSANRVDRQREDRQGCQSKEVSRYAGRLGEGVQSGFREVRIEGAG